MSDLDPGRPNTWNIYTVPDPSPSQAVTDTESQAPWKALGASANAISIGFVATAILVSMFLIMAIFEHLFRPGPSFTSPEAIPGGTLEAGMAGKLENPPGASTPCEAADFSVVMPGHDYPTFIAQPAPLPCSREEIYSHGYYKILLPVSPPHIHLRIYAALLLSLGSLSCPSSSSSSSLSQSLISLLCSALFFSVRSQLQATSCFSISASHSIGFERLLRKMNGCYARMRATGSSTHKSRSVDYSDLLPFSSELENPRTEHGTGESRETARIRGNSGQNAELGDSGLLGWSPRRGKPELPLGGESFRVALRRSCSVASKRLGSRLERQSMGAQCSAVKRAFSMRRSSSVSERYCRIHDQSVTQMDHEEEEEDEGLDMTGSVKKIKNKKRGGKIFKACKRFLGL